MDEPRRLGDRYELGAVLGRGGMAEVHMARDIRLGRAVAVKTLRADLSRDPTFQARFRREAQSAASLNHPSIVAVYDTGEDYLNSVPVPYIVMEYVDGSTLRDLLHSGRRLLPERAMEITIGVLQALEYSHRHGIIHRDIKPANVMLTRQGTVKVMDFGIARAVADNGMTMTQTAAVIGTAQYLSPEQAKGETVDARSDLYSTGCLIYELLTGRPPFTGDSPVAVAYQHVREDPQPPSVHDPEVSPVIDAVVLKSLAKLADNRYQSADEMARDLERALDGRPVAAPTVMVSNLAAAAPTMRVDQVGGAAATAAYGPTTRAFAPEAYGDGQGGDEPPRSRRAGGKKKGGRTGYIVLAVLCVAALVAAFLVGNALLSGGSSSNQVTVPDLTGLQPAAASASASAAQLIAADGNCPTPNSSISSGQIASQSPVAGNFLDKGKTVKYCLSTGAKKVLIPTSYKGQGASTVQQALTNQGFSVTESQAYNANIPAGSVSDVVLQSNNSSSVLGQQVPTTTALVIVVSSGTQTATVPNIVAGTSVQDTENQLKAAGFNTFTTAQQYSSSVPQGTVIAVTPTGQQAVSQTITIEVSQGPQPTTSTTTTPPTSTTTSSPAGGFIGGGNGGGN
jgi:serine/threonine-protein kinase